MDKQIPCETYDRCVGYYSSIKGTNPGKKEEISLRKRYNISSLDKEVKNEVKPC